MAKFIQSAITQAGLTLFAKCVAGTTLEFTRIVIGDGELAAGQTAETMTSLNHQIASCAVQTVELAGANTAKVSCIFSNSSIQTDFYYRELGLFATDPDVGEILYCYGNAGDTADIIPAAGQSIAIEKAVSILTNVTGVQNVTALFDSEAAASRDYVDEQVAELETAYGGRSDAYGIEIDMQARTFKRVGAAQNLTAGVAFDPLAPWARRRCILTDSGDVLAYYGESGYTETGFTTESIEIESDGMTQIFGAGTQVQVMVEQKPVYYKIVPLVTFATDSGQIGMTKFRIYISAQPAEGFKLHPAFNNTQKPLYLSAFDCSIYRSSEDDYDAEDRTMGNDYTVDPTADKLSSVAGANTFKTDNPGLDSRMDFDTIRKMLRDTNGGLLQ